MLRFQFLPFFLSLCLHRYHLFLTPWACISLASSVDKLRRSSHGCMAFATRLHGVRHTVAWRSPHGCRMWIINIVYNFAVEGSRQVQSAAVPTILKKSKKAINRKVADLNITNQEFKSVMDECRELFAKKLHDYGASWRLLRPSSLTDQLLIKARRIRTLETTGKSLVGEGIRPEFIALINYGLVGLIQLEKGFSDTVDMTPDEALALYSQYAKQAFELMTKKNNDYGEAWRDMRVESYTDFILTKIERVKELEDIHEQALVSEGIGANYMDIINYAVFGAIRLGKEGE